ncbi:hypothetical protein GCM10023336_01140 [Streptomyces similanensis]|uniref:Uncharacterized protein n=1 Tax=Streptomyces similanensis TaxID=1274988 RepID=A0ABP9JRZ2_9ACTN
MFHQDPGFTDTRETEDGERRGAGGPRRLRDVTCRRVGEGPARDAAAVLGGAGVRAHAAASGFLRIRSAQVPEAGGLRTRGRAGRRAGAARAAGTETYVINIWTESFLFV